MEAHFRLIVTLILSLFFMSTSSARIDSELSDVEFQSLLQDLIDRRFYIGATVLQYMSRSEIVHDVTLLVPVDASMAQKSGTQYHYRSLVKFHILETSLNFRALKLLPVGTWLPTELSGYGVQVTHNSKNIIALNHVPVIEPNVCPNLAQRGITCHGVNGVLNPLSPLSPKPYGSTLTPKASSPPTISPSPSASQTLTPTVSPMAASPPSNGVVDPTQTSPAPLPPVFQSPTTPPFGISPFLLAPSSDLQSNAMSKMITYVHNYIFVGVGFFLVHMMW